MNQYEKLSHTHITENVIGGERETNGRDWRRERESESGRDWRRVIIQSQIPGEVKLV